MDARTLLFTIKLITMFIKTIDGKVYHTTHINIVDEAGSLMFTPSPLRGFKILEVTEIDTITETDPRLISSTESIPPSSTGK